MTLTHKDLPPEARMALRNWPNEGQDILTIDQAEVLANQQAPKPMGQAAFALVILAGHKLAKYIEAKEGFELTEAGRDMWTALRSDDEFNAAMVGEDSDGNALHMDVNQPDTSEAAQNEQPVRDEISDEQLVSIAEAQYGSDDIEIDNGSICPADKPAVSRGEEGAFVRAWVWVAYPEPEEAEGEEGEAV